MPPQPHPTGNPSYTGGVVRRRRSQRRHKIPLTPISHAGSSFGLARLLLDHLIPLLVAIATGYARQMPAQFPPTYNEMVAVRRRLVAVGHVRASVSRRGHDGGGLGR
jgi:hypothetical protein